MAVQVSYPGVYIEEFTPGAPIEGVGTSTAAFIGASDNGDPNVPTKVTSWDQFKMQFGNEPLSGLYLWYAVRGFFENGGQVCYIVRASKGEAATLEITDQKGGALFKIRSRQLDKPTPDIKVDITQSTSPDVFSSPTAGLYRPTAKFKVTDVRAIEITGAKAADDALQFRPGDWIHLGAGNERRQVIQVSSTSLRVADDLKGAVGDTGSVRLADALSGTRILRIQPADPKKLVPVGLLAPGTMLTIKQATTEESQIVDSVQPEPIPFSTDPITTYRVTFRQGIKKSFDLSKDAAVEGRAFTLKVSQGTADKLYSGLSMDPAHPSYYVSKINDNEGLVIVEPHEPAPSTSIPDNLPKDTGGPKSLAGGKPDDPSALGDADFINALAALREIDDVNLIAIPDSRSTTVQQELIQHCEQLQDRFAILDSGPGEILFGGKSIEARRRGLDSTRGYGALYYPWLRVRPAREGSLILVPPSGHVCGIIARSDLSRGVHKAPANEIVNGALAVERTMSDVDQGQLNLQGINIIRVFQSGGRPVLFGARTTATDKNWQYVNIRRLFLFLEESIQEGIRWAIFEPNNLQLWQKLKRTITEFLMRAWRDGALFGETAEKAFYVRIDEALNPFSEQALGRLHIEIGVRPTYPAEFIIVRIGIWPGGSEVSEG
jgi:phage tail sheath protein FI